MTHRMTLRLDYPDRGHMYAKVFAQIYDSSIADDWQVRLVFEDFLTLADLDGVVDMTPEAISRRTNVPLEVVTRAITVLESPDERSRRQDNDGRRIVRLDDHRSWGWMIVNYHHYRDISSEQQRRECTRNRVKAYRSRRSAVTHGNAVKRSVTEGNDSPYTSPSPSVVASGDGESEGKVETPVDTVPTQMPEDGWTLDHITKASEGVGMRPDALLAYFHNRTASAWCKIGGGPVARNWSQLKSDLSIWKANESSHGKSQRAATDKPRFVSVV